MNPKCPHCPIAGECNSYAGLCERIAKNPARWLPVLNQVNAPASEYPPLLTQLGTAAKAAARFIGSGCATVDRAEFDRRHAICEGCEHFDRAADRCRKCSCHLAVKPWSKAEKCPLKPPKW